jgi:small subunit ribosomal protein S17
MGDRVVIEECKPISKTKAWRVAKLVERARPE